jgi:hypothetical protein
MKLDHVVASAARPAAKATATNQSRRWLAELEREWLLSSRATGVSKAQRSPVSSLDAAGTGSGNSTASEPTAGRPSGLEQSGPMEGEDLRSARATAAVSFGSQVPALKQPVFSPATSEAVTSTHVGQPGDAMQAGVSPPEHSIADVTDHSAKLPQPLRAAVPSRTAIRLGFAPSAVQGDQLPTEVVSQGYLAGDEADGVFSQFNADLQSSGAVLRLRARDAGQVQVNLRDASLNAQQTERAAQALKETMSKAGFSSVRVYVNGVVHNHEGLKSPNERHNVSGSVRCADPPNNGGHHPSNSVREFKEK